MIPFAHRFHGHGSLRYLYKNGRAERTRTITLKHITNPMRQDSRIAVVISKKVLKSAVYRNRVRRKVYEIIRQEIPHFNESHDIVLLIFSGEVLTMPHQELRELICQLLTAANIYKK